MKNNKSSSQTPTLSDLIEIIRDPQLPSTPEYSFPTEADESDPIYMLGQLVAQLERIIENEHSDKSEIDESETAGLEMIQQPTRQQSDEHSKRLHSGSEIERYIELFQKQSAVLRRVMSKLN